MLLVVQRNKNCQCVSCQPGSNGALTSDPGVIGTYSRSGNGVKYFTDIKTALSEQTAIDALTNPQISTPFFLY